MHGVEARRRLAGHRDHVAVGFVEGDVEAQLALQHLDGALLILLGGGDVGQQRAGQLGGDVEILRRAIVVVGQAPQQHRGSHEHCQYDEDGDVELEVEALHGLAVLVLGEDIAGAAQRQDTARLLGVVFDGGADA